MAAAAAESWDDSVVVFVDSDHFVACSRMHPVAVAVVC